jgi:hypothetical protein
MKLLHFDRSQQNSIDLHIDRSKQKWIDRLIDRSKQKMDRSKCLGIKIKTDYLQSIKIKHKIYTIKQNEWGASQER